MAKLLSFTERQATAILEMRLYRLIGLEIEALQKEHKETVRKIERYEKILNDYDEMSRCYHRRSEPSEKGIRCKAPDSA
ncbi:MAG: hypothetical protein ACLUUO_16365 [Sellimonas intestinalis]